MNAQMTIPNIILITNRYSIYRTICSLYWKSRFFNRVCEYHILPRIFLGTPEDSNQNHLSFFSYVIWFFLRYVVFLFFLKRQVLIIWHLVAYIASEEVIAIYQRIIHMLEICHYRLLFYNDIKFYDNFLNIYFC